MPSKTRQDRADAAPKPRATPRRTAAAKATRTTATPAVPDAAPPAEAAPRRRARAATPAATKAAAAPTPAPAPAPKAPRRKAAAKAVPAPEVVEAPAGVEAPAVADAPAAAPVEAAAPAPRRRGTAKPRAQVRAEAPAPVPVPVAPAVVCTGPADGAVFGTWSVQVPGEEDAQVTLRAPRAGSAWCTCLDFALSERGHCPHVQALLEQVQADPDRAAAFHRGPQRVASRVEVQQGGRRRLLWLPGTECPAALNELGATLLDCDEPDDQALPRLLRAAREAGHELQVDDTAWALVAVARDARWRVHRLETLLPDGPSAAELLALPGPDAPPLLPLQVEGALFAVCAGRCLLADTPELQPQRQALAAIALWRAHFGVERVLVLAPAAALDRWRRALPAAPGSLHVMALDNVAGDVELHRALAPELVVVDEDPAGGLWVDAERAAALLKLRSAHAIVLPGAAWLQRPAELPLRLAFVDADRQGAYAALLQVHGQRDEAGDLVGLQGLDSLRDTLAPVLLARTLDEVRAQLPDRVDLQRAVPLSADDQAAHAALVARLATSLDRIKRSGWLPDAQQRQLLDQVQALRRWCAGDGAPTVAAAKAAALLQLLNAGDTPVAKAVVFGQWPAALDAVQAALEAAGVGCARWQAADGAAVRDAAVQRWQADAGCRLLLVADPGSTALDLRCPGAQVIHLDRPWNPRTLTRRFGRVHRRGKAHLVPVTQLLATPSFESALAQVLPERRDGVCETLDANAAEGFVQGEALVQLLAELGQVVAALPSA